MTLGAFVCSGEEDSDEEDDYDDDDDMDLWRDVCHSFRHCLLCNTVAGKTAELYVRVWKNNWAGAG